MVSASFRHLASSILDGQLSASKRPTFHTRDRCVQAEKMTTALGNRKNEFVVTGLTATLIVLTILTYILDQQKSNWVCGPVLFVLEIFAIGLQSFLTVTTWKTRNHRTKLILLFVSLLIVGLVAFGFMNFNLNCT